MAIGYGIISLVLLTDSKGVMTVLMILLPVMMMSTILLAGN